MLVNKYKCTLNMFAKGHFKPFIHINKQKGQLTSPSMHWWKINYYLYKTICNWIISLWQTFRRCCSGTSVRLVTYRYNNVVFKSLYNMCWWELTNWWNVAFHTWHPTYYMSIARWSYHYRICMILHTQYY